MHEWVLPVPVPPMKIALRLAFRECAGGEFTNLPFIDWRIGEDERVDIFEDWERGPADAIGDRAGLAVRAFRADQAGDEEIDGGRVNPN